MRRTAVILMCAVLFASVSYARRHSAPSVPVEEIEGTIHTVSTTQIVVATERLGDVTVAITDTTIFRQGEMAIAPADLNSGDRVEIKAVRDNDVLNALLVKLQNPAEQPEPEFREINGVLKSVSPTEIVVTDAGGTDTTLALSSDTVFMKDGQAATAADLAVGDRVEVKATNVANVLTAVAVNDEESQNADSVELNGVIKSASATEVVVTDAAGNDTTVEITSDTIIRKNDQLATPADLAVGDRVEVKAVADGTTLNALVINAEAKEDDTQQDAEVSGTVKSVGSDSITVTPRGGSDVVVQTDANTRIQKDDRTIALTDIKAGDRVEAKGTRVDASTILARSIEVKGSKG